MSIVHLLFLAMASTLGANAGVFDVPRQPPLPVVQADADGSIPEIKGTEWLLRSLHGADVDPEIGSSLGFDDEGNAFGNGGCNRFRGSAEIVGDSLKFGNLASTMMACMEPNSTQEAAFHAALAETVAFRGEEADLLLLNSKDEIVARLSPAE